ncbi:hypothetical protein HS088_TW04G00127 [Tripterygium wilfordii]|uniref:Auxin-responsive protein n=1 Tax=Tripterygium wilfordii TaxID=458696 RepID=A0A7J7DPE2_TRIWF|nr:hypothetical protein HS088_TW04G00127 [Tripterygium wilfordii]
MELELGLGLPIRYPMKGLDLNNNEKRCFEEAIDIPEKTEDETQMLHLQLWSSGNDDHKGGQKRRAYSPIAKDDEEINVKTRRKNESLIDHHHQHQWNQNYFVEENYIGDSSNSISMYVKVKMEGVAIVRKIDLMLYNSYQTLTNSLINMFSKCYKHEKDEDDHVRYTLTYQDKQGDWLLAGDVPWSFIKSVRRLQIIRSRTMEADMG